MSDHPYIVAVWFHGGCAHWIYFYEKDKKSRHSMVARARGYFEPRLEGQCRQVVVETEPRLIPQRRIVSPRNRD